MTLTVLMVAEKPMLADSIAQLLSNGNASKRKGFNGVCSVSEYIGDFQGKTARFKVTSTCGHVMSLDFPQKYNNWERVDPVELYSAPAQKIEANPKLKMNDFLASEARNADYLVLWLDCDKEGENICFEVIEAVKNIMFKSRSNYMDFVYRAHFSAITERDIKFAMTKLGRPDHNMALSVDARQELDLRIGCSFTRFQTKFFQGKYGDLDSNVISYGPCQTPTLGFCVARHDQIVQFKPESYWVMKMTIVCDSQEFTPEWSRGRMFDPEVANIFVERLKKSGTGIVADICKKESRKDRPCALNTVELMRVASSFLGLSPSTTMHVAENLYTQGFISYPRTETTAYPTNFDLVATLKTLSSEGKYAPIVSDILAEGVKRPKSGVDKGDHPPITPMKKNLGCLSGDMARVYEYICQHFIATLMKPCTFEVTNVQLICGEESFTIQGKQVIEPGFTTVMPWNGIEDDSQANLNVLKTGSEVFVKNVQIQSRETTPPGYLSEAELITLMEKHGIGTDASIPVHINTITQRNYVTVESGRRLVPTRLGQCLVRGYWMIDPELVLPTMRSELEEQLNLVASGKADYNDVKNYALRMFEMKFQYFVSNITSVDSLFEASFTTISDAGRPFSRCGKCRRYMKLVQTKPYRLFCSACQDTYAIPNFKDGVLKVIGDQKCPLDDFDVVFWQGTGGKLARSFTLCPFCFNNTPFESMQQNSGCDNCPHTSCGHSVNSLGVSGCIRNCGGVLLLDTQSSPKWRLTCNKCPSVISLFEGAYRVKVDPAQNCSNCGSQFVRAEYRESVIEKCAPEVPGIFFGCIFCDAMKKFPATVNLNHAFLSEVTITQSDRKKFHGKKLGKGKKLAFR